LDNREEAPPLEESGEDDERQSRGIVEAARLDPTLAVERQLLAEEEILGGQARMRAHAEREPVQEITDQSKDDARHHRMADDTAPSCPTHSGFGTHRSAARPVRPDRIREEFFAEYSSDHRDRNC
jgi:hypothetical protein